MVESSSHRGSLPLTLTMSTGIISVLVAAIAYALYANAGTGTEATWESVQAKLPPQAVVSTPLALFTWYIFYYINV